MLPADAELGFFLAGQRDVTLRAKALDLFQRARAEMVAQQAESFQVLPRPRGHALRVLQSARDLVAALASFHRQHKLDPFDLRQLRQRGGERIAGRPSAVDRAAQTRPSPGRIRAAARCKT